MPVFKRKKMCDECPFRADAVRGWLGPLTVDDLMKFVHGPTEIVPGSYVGDVGELICHKDIARLQDAGAEGEEISERGNMCVGMIRYTNSVMKEARDPDVRAFQHACKKVKDDPVIPQFRLKEYHTLTPIAKKAKPRKQAAKKSK
jgi:hypothetical protein